MPFLRLARDQRGYETTILLHAAQAGARPRILYWYRSAPGVRVGRPALDEDAIRTIEEQHPEIDFDWPHILEVHASAILEVERRPERGPKSRGVDRARAARVREETPPVAGLPTGPPAQTADPDESIDEQPLEGADEDSAIPEPAHASDLLVELVGRDIATRLRARYAEINARIHQLPGDAATRAVWQARAEPLNPDSWLTPEEILRGVNHADELFDALRRELLR